MTCFLEAAFGSLRSRAAIVRVRVDRKLGLLADSYSIPRVTQVVMAYE